MDGLTEKEKKKKTGKELIDTDTSVLIARGRGWRVGEINGDGETLTWDEHTIQCTDDVL